MAGPEHQVVEGIARRRWEVEVEGEEERKDSSTRDKRTRQRLHPPRHRGRKVACSVMVWSRAVRGGELSICLLSKNIAGGLVQDAAYGKGVEFRGQALSIRKWRSPFLFRDNLVQDVEGNNR